jgi:hypothetical protein
MISLYDTPYIAKIFAAPMVTPPVSQPQSQAQIAQTYCTVCDSGLLLMEKAAAQSP